MQVLGKGPVVVFESGLGAGHHSWKVVTAVLAPCFTVVTDGRQEAGRHISAGRPLPPVLAADVANDLLERLHARHLPEPYILVGHSLGGLYVQTFARNHPAATAGIVLVDATSPLEPPGVFVSTVPPKPGTAEAAEEAGVIPSVAALLTGPKLPAVPLIVIAATSHHDTPAREALWQDVQRRTAALSPKGRLVVVHSGHFVQAEHPMAVVAAVRRVAAEAGMERAGCRRSPPD